MVEIALNHKMVQAHEELSPQNMAKDEEEM